MRTKNNSAARMNKRGPWPVTPEAANGADFGFMEGQAMPSAARVKEGFQRRRRTCFSAAARPC